VNQQTIISSYATDSRRTSAVL